MSTSDNPSAAAAGSIPCAVIHTQADCVLALESRPGRHPITVTLMREPIIGWVANDGLHEFIELKGDSGIGDFQALQAHFQGDGILVAEVGDMGAPDIEAASYFEVKRDVPAVPEAPK